MATLIINIAGLQAMEDDLAADYKLGNDIYATVTIGWNDGAGFAPIGDNSTKFTGSFDGRGYTINDLYINRDTERYVGLFGYTNGGDIENVGMVDCDITGVAFVGALAGAGGGTGISNCYSTGSVSASVAVGTEKAPSSIGGLLGYSYTLVSNCHSSCAVTCTGGLYNTGECGGLIGTAAASGGLGAVTKCWSSGGVIVTSDGGANQWNDGDIDQVGGLIGYITSGKLTSKCYSVGNVSVTAANKSKGIGGFTGNTNSNIFDCYARGNISVSVGDNSWGDIGGFIGIVEDAGADIDNSYSTGSISETPGMPDIGGFCGDNSGTISNCFWDTQTSGEATSDGGTGKTTTQMKTVSTFTDAGWVFYGQFDVESPIWHITTNRNNGYPMLPAQGFGHYWIEGARWTFMGELGKQQILGTDTTADGTAGYYFIDGSYWHYLSSGGNERRQKGRATGASGEAGYYWIDDLRWRYIDSSGNVRHIGSWGLNSARLGVDTYLHA